MESHLYLNQRSLTDNCLLMLDLTLLLEKRSVVARPWSCDRLGYGCTFQASLQVLDFHCFKFSPRHIGYGHGIMPAILPSGQA